MCARARSTVSKHIVHKTLEYNDKMLYVLIQWDILYDIQLIPLQAYVQRAMRFAPREPRQGRRDSSYVTHTAHTHSAHTRTYIISLTSNGSRRTFVLRSYVSVVNAIARSTSLRAVIMIRFPFFRFVLCAAPARCLTPFLPCVRSRKIAR